MTKQEHMFLSSGKLRNATQSANPLNTQRLQEWAIGMAEHVASLSKDPSTKVGAVILDANRRLISGGYNGFARGVHDTPARLNDRDVKLKMTLHAEKNAILFATAPLEGSTIVVTHPCCAQCAAQIIQAGIANVMWRKPKREFVMRWRDDMKLTCEMFEEAGVRVHEVEL